MLTDRAEGIIRISVSVKYAAMGVLYALSCVVAAAARQAVLTDAATLVAGGIAVFVALQAFGPSWQQWSQGYFHRRRRTAVRNAVRETILCALTLLGLHYSPLAGSVSSGFAAGFLAAGFGFLIFANARLPRMLSRLLYRNACADRAVVIGRLTDVEALQHWRSITDDLGIDVVGVLDPDADEFDPDRLFCLDPNQETTGRRIIQRPGILARLRRLARNGNIQQVICVGTDPSDSSGNLRFGVENICDEFGLRLAFWVRPLSTRHRPFPATSVDGNAALLAASEPLQNPLNRLLKRTLDIAVSLPVVILLLPPLCAVIKLTQWYQSAGPLFYFQERCGNRCQRFTIYKFRSMHLPQPGASDIDEDAENRVFRAGRFLRASRIDELPQFINVLLGHMSVVGPRPHHAQDRRRFSRIVSHYPLRTIVKPGITGLAQYKEYRGVVHRDCVQSRLQRDMDYINHWSLWLDLQLIVKTSRVILEAVIRTVFPQPAPSAPVVLTAPAAVPPQTQPVLRFRIFSGVSESAVSLPQPVDVKSLEQPHAPRAA